MKILIADDEKSIVGILVKYLTKKGLSVDSALDGDEALKLIMEREYDIVFLDIDMPGLSGLEILRYTKENNIRSKMVLLTGYPRAKEDFTETLQADEYLEKPVKLEVIGNILDKYSPDPHNRNV